MKLTTTGAAAAAVLALSLTLSACGGGGGDEGSSGDGGGRIAIGIKYDQPGLGLKKPDGSFAGFDVDVATYVAKELGYDAKDIDWKETPSAERENAIANGDVTFVVASYSITDERKQKVDFAGPYLLAHQDLLVRADDTGITKAEDLNSKKLCSVTGSTSAQNIKNELAPKADLQEFGGYSECLTGLENKAVDALTTDDSILAGYASQKEHQGKFRLAGLKLSDENYGIGLKKGDTALRDKVNTALKKMVSDGAWQKAVTANFGPAGYKNEPAPAVAG